MNHLVYVSYAPAWMGCEKIFLFSIIRWDSGEKWRSRKISLSAYKSCTYELIEWSSIFNISA